MGIWEFTDFEYKKLNRILYHCESLEKFGIEQDDDMMAELRAEIKKQGEEEE